jgi:hypothetical protein
MFKNNKQLFYVGGGDRVIIQQNVGGNTEDKTKKEKI